MGDSGPGVVGGGAGGQDNTGPGAGQHQQDQHQVGGQISIYGY